MDETGSWRTRGTGQGHTCLSNDFKTCCTSVSHSIMFCLLYGCHPGFSFAFSFISFCFMGCLWFLPSDAWWVYLKDCLPPLLPNQWRHGSVHGSVVAGVTRKLWTSELHSIISISFFLNLLGNCIRKLSRISWANQRRIFSYNPANNFKYITSFVCVSVHMCVW